MNKVDENKHIFVDTYLFFDESLLSEDKIFVEVGAFSGQHAMGLLDRYNCKVIVYEASETNFVSLENNVKEYKNRELILHNKAVNKDDGTVTFYEFRNPASNSVYPRHQTGRRRRKLKKHYVVDSVSLSSILKENDIDHVDTIFLNCEGAEISILHGFFESKELHDKITQLSVSFHPQIYGNMPIKETLKRAESSGFSFIISNKTFPCTLFIKNEP